MTPPRRRGSRVARARVVGILVTVLAPVLLVGVPGAHAQSASASPDDAVPLDVGARSVDLAIQLTQANARLNLTDRDITDVTARLAAADAALREAERRRAAAQADLQESLDRLQGRAAQSYQMGGSGLDPVLDLNRLDALSKATKYANAAAAVDNSDVERLTALVAELTQARDAAAAEQQALTARTAQLAGERAALADQAKALEFELAQLGGVPVSGVSTLTAAQLTAWFESTGSHANLPEGTTIADLVQMYLEEGAAEHVRGDLAFAQSVLETGSFRETRGNNYAGIGNCDSCGGKGIFFPTPREGVRAQIQLLRNYADPASRVVNLAHPPDPSLYGGDPVVAASKYDTFFKKGQVPLWNQMGNGNWATSTTYAAKVLGIYSRMLAFAAGSGG